MTAEAPRSDTSSLLVVAPSTTAHTARKRRRFMLCALAVADRLAAPCTEGLRAGRSAVDPDESHVSPPNEKQNTVSVG
jgi:hypothetical protein